MFCCLKKQSAEELPLLVPLLYHDVNIVAFTGLAGSGKDTAADLLVEEGYLKLAFADPLKKGIHELFGISMETLADPEKKQEIDQEWGVSPRKLMQWLGTDVLRKDISDDFFLVSMAKRIKESGAKNIVIPDCRFDIEAKFIRSCGGRVYRMYRNGQTSISDENLKKHASENGISSDFVEKTILNSGTLEDLCEIIKGLLVHETHMRSHSLEGQPSSHHLGLI